MKKNHDFSYLSFFHEIDSLNTLYPLGDNYVLNKIKIVDKFDCLKVIYWDINNGMENGITNKEINLLFSMKSPEICITYGISKDYENEFVSALSTPYRYTSLPLEEVRNAIISGLEIPSNATNEEIFDAIKNKKYSTTPIKDARLTKKIKELDELQYYETIASLDSLVCNLAASLAVSVDNELIYVSGYLNDDEYIRANEAHAWAMYEDGRIVDITPSDVVFSKKIENSIKIMIKWCIRMHIPTYMFTFMIGFILNKLFGKKVMVYFNIQKAKKMLKDSNLGESYSQLLEMVYGGISVAKEQTPSEYVDTIKNDFVSYSKEELEELKKDLEKSKLYNSKEYSYTWKLIDEIPFIVENSDVLKRSLEKDKSK